MGGGGGLGAARDGRIKYDDNTWQTGDRIRANYFRAEVVEYLPKNTWPYYFADYPQKERAG